MCWIFAYKWTKEATNILVNWLRNLEYRWYDSAWICELNSSWEKYLIKATWKVSNLATKIEKENKDLDWYNIWIAHTRWATHWSVTEENTHPHYSQNQRFYVVHNWIIENYIDIKKSLESEWIKFYSETDSEVIAKLIEKHFEKDLEATIAKVTKTLTWAYALAVIDTKKPDELIWAKIWSPMVLGLKENEFFISSDVNAIAPVCSNYVTLEDWEMLVISGNEYKITNADSIVKKEIQEIWDKAEEVMLWDFNHFMEKEIFEIPSILENALNWRVDFKEKQITSNTLEKLWKLNIKNIEIIASGTSYNAWYTAMYWFEELSWIRAQVHISTEYKYKKQFIDKETLYVFISQSWETADSLECLKAIKNKWWLVFWVVNVVWSSIARLSDMGLYTHSWTEIWVASTKAFIGQLSTLLLTALYLWNKKDLDYIRFKNIIEWLEKLKDDINLILLNSKKIQEVAKKYSKYKDMFFLWRNSLYPAAMEWSLKCKEITYNHTEAYSAWELKHWPLSLIDKNFPTLLINPKTKLYEKNISTLKEIKAREWEVIWVISTWDKYSDLYDDTIEIPEVIEELNPFTTAVALQLFAYYMALDLDREIDKPRNLAKSVTVE